MKQLIFPTQSPRIKFRVFLLTMYKKQKHLQQLVQIVVLLINIGPVEQKLVEHLVERKTQEADVSPVQMFGNNICVEAQSQLITENVIPLAQGIKS